MSPHHLIRALAAMAVLAACGCTPGPGRVDTGAMLPAMPPPGAPCPQWTLYPADRHSGDGSPLLGCVTRANLRSMLVDPGELDRAHPPSPADGGRMIKAIDDYRDGHRPTGQGAGAAVPTLMMPGAGGGSPQ